MAESEASRWMAESEASMTNAGGNISVSNLATASYISWLGNQWTNLATRSSR
jgi:hypothetical protein